MKSRFLSSYIVLAIIISTLLFTEKITIGKSEGDFQLTGLIPNSRGGVAIINNQSYQVGELINGYTITGISKDYVELKKNGNVVKLRLGDGISEEKDIAHLNQENVDAEPLMSRFWTGDKMTTNEMEMVHRYGWSWLNDDRKKEIKDGLDAAVSQAKKDKAHYDEMMELAQMSYIQISERYNMSSVVAHKFLQEVRSFVDELEPFASPRAQKRIQDEAAQVRDLMKIGVGPFIEDRRKMEHVANDPSKAKFVRDYCRRALKRYNDTTRGLDDGITRVYNQGLKFAEYLAIIDERADKLRVALAKDELNKVTTILDGAEIPAAMNRIQMSAMADSLENIYHMDLLSAVYSNPRLNAALFKELPKLKRHLTSGDMEGAEEVLSTLVTGEDYFIRTPPEFGETEPNVKYATDAQKRQLFLTILDPRSQTLARIWVIINDETENADGEYDVTNDFVIQDIQAMVARGNIDSVREVVLNMETLLEKLEKLGFHGRDKNYINILKKELGI